jgi:5'-nucleotidase
MDAAKIALFDMDGSLADFDAMRHELRLLRADSEKPITDATNLHALEEAHPFIKRRMDKVKSVPMWWRNLPRIEAFVVLREAASLGFTVNILTKGPSGHSNAWMEKLHWCNDQPELSDANVHLTMNKGLVYGVMLYDDFPPYMESWLAHRPRGLGIMPATPYNESFSHPNVIKWTGTNLPKVVDAMRVAFSRSH